MQGGEEDSPARGREGNGNLRESVLGQKLVVEKKTINWV